MAGPAQIFIVDDHETVGRTLQAIFKDEGYLVWTANSVTAAVALLDTETFDVAIVDLNLGGESGMSVIRALRTRQPDCNAIILTGYPSADSATEAARLRVYAYLTKPSNLDHLKSTVRGALEQRPAPQALRYVDGAKPSSPDGLDTSQSVPKDSAKR